MKRYSTLKQKHKSEMILWSVSIFLTVLTGAVNSVLVVFLLKKMVEVILQDGVHAPYLLALFALSVAAGALLEILRQKLRYILYRKRVVRLEDRLISASCVRGGGGNKAFVLIQNTVNDLVAKQTDWVLDCCNIIGVSAILGIYICTISVTALLICLAVTALALLLMWKDNQKIPDASKASNEKMNAVYEEMWNYLRCKEMLPFLRPRVYRKFEAKLEENRQGLVLVNRHANTARICMRFGSVGITLIAVLYFGMLAIRGKFTLPELLAVTMLLPNLAESLLQIPDCAARRKKLVGMEKNVDSFLEEREETEDAEAGIGESLGGKITDITASGIEYSYQQGGCSCRVEGFLAQSGSVTGIFGESGAGKTTLLRIILGELTGSAGECRINGRKVESLDRQELWSHILYLPQKPVLLPVDLRGNVTLTGDRGLIDEKRYSEALKKVGIEGLAAVKGEEGLDEGALSSGERQKVCLARCFYTDKEVLILDEATNALSPGAEKEILHNLANEAARKNKILILVSHNPSAAEFCDRAVRVIN